jgi:hypothetical protein
MAIVETQETTTMALGKRSDEQQEMWVVTTSLPKSEGHVFYRKLNRLLAEVDFDRTVEKICGPYYHDHVGRPSIPPGVYFRMLLVSAISKASARNGALPGVVATAFRCGSSSASRSRKRRPITPA